MIILPESIAKQFSLAANRKVSKTEAGRILRGCGLVAENGEKRTAAVKGDGLPRMVKLDKKALKKSAKNRF